MVYFNKVIILLSFLIFISSSFGEVINGLDDADYLCFEKIVTKFNLIVKYPKNGKYSFCVESTCSGGVVTSLTIDGLGETLTAGKIVEIADISCFASATAMYIRRLPVDPAIIYNKFTNVQHMNYVDVLGPNVGITQEIPPYTGFQLFSNEILNNTRVKLSYINSMIESLNIGAELIYVDRDIPKINDKLEKLRLDGLMNLPDFQDFKSFTYVDLFLNGKYDESTLSVFDNYSTKPQGYITIIWPVPSKPIPFFATNNKKALQVVFIYPNFVKPVSMIDISKTANYHDLRIQLIQNGDVFNINGAIPLIVNSTVTSLSITYGEITVLPQLDQYRQIKVYSSKLASELPKFIGNASKVDFSYNKITGTIDPSFCSTELIVTSNKLTGIIPSCFTCYMTGVLYDTMDSNFAYNNFTNTGSGLDCPTIAPIVTKVDNDSILIEGIDIGFSLNNFAINGGSNCEITNSKVIQSGKSYLCFIKSHFWSSYVTVTWSPLSKSFTFPLIVSPPNITSIISTTNNANNLNILMITGNFFSSYNGYKNQLIKLGTRDGSMVGDCDTKSTDFFEIICETKEKLSLDQLVYLLVTTDGLSKKVYFNTTDSFVNNIKCSNNNCSNRGYCDLSKGVCVCEDGIWSGVDCAAPHHYITSITPSTINGGNVIVYGSFGTEHSGLSITIGGIDCPIVTSSITPNEIHCTAVKGNGVTELSVTQNGVSASLKYQYTELTQSCPLNCSNHGTCNSNNGECTCFISYSTYDCSVKIDNGGSGGNIKPPTNTTIDNGTGGTNITNQEINFSIYFKSLSEIDINGKPVEIYTLQDNWKLNSTNSQNQHVFKQTIQHGNTCSIISTIEEIKEEYGKQFEFSGTSFKLEKNSIKFTIEISNFTFKNNLNTLQLDLISMVDQDGDNKCNTKDTEINSNDLSTFNYIKISKNNKILSGRFINKLQSNGKPTYLNTVITKEKDSIIVSLKLPHCTHCMIDPDFSVLVSNDFKTSCDNDGSSRKWVIPVAVVVSVVGATILSISIFMLFKKSTSVKVKLLQLKRFNK